MSVLLYISANVFPHLLRSVFLIIILVIMQYSMAWVFNLPTYRDLRFGSFFQGLSSAVFDTPHMDAPGLSKRALDQLHLSLGASSFRLQDPGKYFTAVLFCFVLTSLHLDALTFFLDTDSLENKTVFNSEPLAFSRIFDISWCLLF